MLVLLRQEANATDLSGHFRRLRADGIAQSEFRYTVTRIWELPVERVLSGELAWLPLAPLTQVAAEEVPRILRRMNDRLEAEVPPARANDLWSATYLLAGLRYTPDESAALFRGIRAMRESSTYQAILAEGRAEGEARGRAEEAKRILELVAGQRFGPPAARPRRALNALSNIVRIERISARLLTARDWDDLLATP